MRARKFFFQAGDPLFRRVFHRQIQFFFSRDRLCLNVYRLLRYRLTIFCVSRVFRLFMF